VLKPAELTPLTALRFEQLALEAGTAEGVVNVVAGPGSTCGRRLVEHPDVAKVAFTGSTSVGRSIAAGAAQTIKRVTLELGGKSANVIFADADLERAAAAAPGAVFGNAGQDCCARSRILVQRSALDASCGAASSRRSASASGDPLDEATEMGPAHLGRPARDGRLSSRTGARGHPRARRRTARVLVPAHRARARSTARPRGARGDLRPGRRGHPVRRRGGGDRAGQRHDLRALGLDLDARRRRALRVARAIEAGVLSINSNTSVRVSTPFGGFKQSGVGRELGPHALDAYSEVKSIYYATGA
jgi:betaine-aldehyde dehydrogenase